MRPKHFIYYYYFELDKKCLRTLIFTKYFCRYWMSCVRTHFNANLQEILRELNNRSLEELSNTKGIGKSKAISLVQYRDNFGPFQSIEDLFLIKGFGSAFFNNLQEAGELAAVKKKTSKGLETIRELLIRNKKEVGTICISCSTGARTIA